MKAIIFTDWFEPPDELLKFVKSLGYKNPCFSKNFDIMFDSRVIEFCEKKLDELWDEFVYKGKESNRFRIGFAGAGYIREIDTSKKWVIYGNEVDAPIITYVDVVVDAYGHVKINAQK